MVGRLARILWASAVAIALLAGCFGTPPPLGSDAGAWTLVCPGAAADVASCSGSLGDDRHRNQEVSLATHPSDARTALVAWIDRTTQTIWTAITHDDGATWTQQQLHHPAHRNDVTGGWVATDPVAAFAPDGDALVLFMDLHIGFVGQEVGPAYAYLYEQREDPLVLARSSDGGGTWSYSAITAPLDGWLFFPDYPGFAIAPDTGEMFVVAQTFTMTPAFPVVIYEGTIYGGGQGTQGGSFLWKSTDGGVTWTDPVPLRGSAQAVGDRFDTYTRVAAGAGGLVVVTGMQVTSVAGATSSSLDGAVAWVSHDGGATFTSTALGDLQPLGAPWIDGATVTILAASEPTLDGPPGSDLFLVRSNDGGGTWGAPEPLASLPPQVDWVVGAGVRNGVAALARVGPEEDGSFRVRLLLPDVALDLAEPDPRAGWGDYGGLAVAADGTVWAAWVAPAGDEHSQVAVLRLRPTA